MEPLLKFCLSFLVLPAVLALGSAVATWFAHRRRGASIKRAALISLVAGMVGALVGLVLTPYTFDLRRAVSGARGNQDQQMFAQGMGHGLAHYEKTANSPTMRRKIERPPTASETPRLFPWVAD